jgi:hypothetical protein
MPGFEEEVGNTAAPEEKIESTDVSLSASVVGIGLVEMQRPNEGDMYSLFFEDGAGNKDEVAFIGGDTATARKEFDAIKDFLRSQSWHNPQEAKKAVRDFIVQLHGGIAEQK